MDNKIMNIEEQLKQAASDAILRIVKEGSWIMPDYGNRFNVPKDFIQEVWGLVDKNALKKQLAKEIEKELANRIVNQIATEIATDIKQVLSVPERREAIRELARQNLKAIMAKGKDEQSTH